MRLLPANRTENAVRNPVVCESGASSVLFCCIHREMAYCTISGLLHRCTTQLRNVCKQITVIPKNLCCISRTSFEATWSPLTFAFPSQKSFSTQLCDGYLNKQLYTRPARRPPRLRSHRLLPRILPVGSYD